MKKLITISNVINEDIKSYAKEQGITHSQTVEIALRSFFRLYEATQKISQSFKDLPIAKGHDIKK